MADLVKIVMDNKENIVVSIIVGLILFGLVGLVVFGEIPGEKEYKDSLSRATKITADDKSQ
jgi:hypothetical protein